MAQYVQLKKWTARIKRALKRGSFDSRAYYDIMDPCKCVNGELAKILGLTYTGVKARYKPIHNAEEIIIRAVRQNQPEMALLAVGIIEDVVNQK
jgi:hypothetical protein